MSELQNEKKNQGFCYIVLQDMHDTIVDVTGYISGSGAHP